MIQLFHLDLKRGKNIYDGGFSLHTVMMVGVGSMASIEATFDPLYIRIIFVPTERPQN
jgi:hypothetical protein